MKRSIPASGTAAFFARGTRFVASAIFASFTFAAAQTANAKNFYWTGKTDTKFETTSNWTVSGSGDRTLPTNDDLFVDKSQSGFKNTTMVFASAVVNNWKNWIRNVGTEDAPFVFKGSQAAYGITVGNADSKGWYIASESNDSGDAYVRFDTGTFATGEGDTKAVWKIGGTKRAGYVTVNGATINSPGDFYLQRGSLTVNSGTVTVNGNFRLGDVRAVTLTVNGGTMYAGGWTRLENSSAGNYNKTINLNGGEMRTATITVIGGGGTKTVNFNGGTLKNTYVNATHGLIDTGVAVKIKAGGGTIDTNAKAPVIVPDMNEDASSPGGGMTFKGGGSVTLAGAIGWTGGTTIEAGTTVKVDTATKKDALLGSGLNTLKVIPASAGTHTLVTITGEDTFTDADLRKASLSTGAGTFSLSNDGKSLVVEISYAGGEINQTTPTLVFPGAALADLATRTLRARMEGNNFDADGTEATFFKISDDGTKATYQLQALDDTSSHHFTKAVKVEFTADANGVYAKLVEGNYANYGNPNQFGTDPLTTNPGKSGYIPYDFRLVEPATAISVNFTRSGTNLDTSSSVRYGAGDYAVPYSSWNNMAAANNGTDTFGGATVKITKTSGAYGCSNLNGAKDVRHGYLDDGGLTVVVEVTNIPYEFYRMVTYHATDNADIKFGHVTINGVNYTGTTDATVKGNATWGATGAANYSFGLREGVNYLVSDVMTAPSATITGHRDKSSGPTARGCIAAIQIVEYTPETYTATIDDGGDKTFSALDWDKALPAALTAGDQVVLNVNEDTTLTLDSALDVYAIKFNVAAGKTLTLAGQNVAAQYITATGAGQTVVGSATRLAGTVKGDGTLVYSGAAPSGVAFTDAAWEGVLWLKNGTMNGLLAQNLAKENSTLRLTGVTGYFNNGDSEMTSEGALELVDDGSTPAFTVSNGYSTSGKTVFAALTGDGTFKADTTTAQRYVFKDVSAFTGTIDIPSGNNTRVILGDGASLAPANGTISVAAGATATVAAGKTWVANGGMIVNGTLILGTGATAPAVVSGTGTVGVASGTGTLAGYGANAVLELATAPGATLAIVDARLATMTVGAFNNLGTVDLRGTALTEVTLNLASGVTAAATGTILYPATFEKFVVSPVDQSVRTLADFSTLPTLPEGAAYYVTLAETREEFGKGLLEVADCAAGVNVRVARPDGTFADVAPVNGVATLEGVHIAGAATAFDFTYTNTAEKAYSAPGLSIGWNADTKPVTFNNNASDKTTGAYIKHHPWVTGAGDLIALENFTIVLVGTMSPSPNTQFFHMGTTTDQNKGILITTTENENEVMIAKNAGSSVDAAGGVKASVPNAATARHAYVIKKKGTVVEVWVDGVKRGQFDGGEGFALPSSGGMQVGSDHGGKIREGGVYNAVANTDDETGYLNVLRMFDYSITDAQAEAVFAEYPYVSQGGLYTREVSADGAFSQADAWQKEGEAGAFAVPAGATVDDIFYNPSATLTANAAAELEVNATVSIENLTVGGSAALTFASDGEHTVSVLGAAIINSPVTNEYGAVYLAGAPVQLGSSGAICFDCSGIDVSKVYAVTRFQLTGLTDQSDEKVTAIFPTDPDRSYEIVYNTTGSCYDLVVTPLHNYVVVENRVVDSPSLTEDNIIVGAGGFDIETLSIPDNARFVYDPVKTPIYVYGWTDGAFTVGEGAKLALSADYAGTTLGRIVLCIYKEECAVLPADLNDIFDSSSIAPGATWAVTSEDAPDPSGGRKQLVLTVGDYANDAKEIRILPVGDSITQGVYIENSGDAQDRYPQYRSTIAARLAAQGYKPKMLGVWKRANYDAAHTMIPEDWAWHCGLNAERIVAGGNRGGVRDNMHVYLDIAGDVNVVTLLIGTNDIGAGATGEETYNEFTNVVFAIAAQRPGAKIIGATILDRSGDENKAQIAAFNALLKADNAAGNLPANFVLLDLHAAVPLDGTGNFLPRDNLHLHWKGCVAAGEAFASAIASALPLTGEGAITGAPDATVTSEAQIALGAANIAELANYRNGFTRVYAIEKTGAAGATNCFTTAAPYTAIEDYSAATRPVLRAGYYMELVRKGTNRRRYVWVDFDAEGKTLGDIDFPWQGENMNCTVEKLHVYSNDPSIHNIAANDDTATGAVEGTWHNYTGTDDDDGVPADVIAGAYGWNDTMGSGDAGYGCFQIHRIFSQTGDDVHWNDAETLFAWNRWGRAEQVDEIGIGSFAKSNTLGGNNFSMDYTFTAETADGAIDTLSSDAYSVRRLEIWAEFAGSPRHGAWSGTAGDGNFDTAANWEDGRVPSAGENIDFSALAADAAIAVAGASSGQKFGAATMGAGVVTFTGDIAFSAISDTSKIAVSANSTVTLDGDLVFSGGEAGVNNYIVYTVAEGGKFAVTGDIVADTDFLGYVYHSYTAGGGAVQARGVANNATSNSDAWAFRLSANDGTAVANWIVGDHGLFGSKGLWTHGSRPISLRPDGAGLVIAANVGINSACEFNTTGTDGNACTITIGDGTSGAFSRSGAMNVTGAGTLLVNSSSDATSPVSVAGGATLAIKAGKQLTTGAITVGSNATLSLPQTGTVTLGGDLELEDDAALEFSPSGVTDSTLAIASGRTLKLPDAGIVTVKFASKALVKPGRSYTLLAGAGLADASKSKFALESGDGGTLSVSGGDLVYTAPRYFMIRIADGDAEESIPVAWDWIVENGYGTPADTEAAVSTAIAGSAANGLPAWQCYCLGLDPEDAASRIYCAKSADQTGVEAGSVRVAAANLNVPENPELAVSASLERSADLVNWEIADGPDAVPSGSVEFIATISENASVSYFRISAHIAAASGS